MYFRDILSRYDSGSDVGVLGSGYEFLLSWNLTTKYIIKTHYTVYYKRHIIKCITKYNCYKDIVKNKINDLLAKKNCRPLQRVSPSPLPVLFVFTLYLKSTNLTTQVDPSSPSSVVHRTYFQLFRQNYGTYCQNFKDSQHALEIFRELNFLKTYFHYGYHIS